MPLNPIEFRFIVRAMRKAIPQLVGAPPEFCQKFISEAVKDALADAAEESGGDAGIEVGMVTRGQALPQPINSIRPFTQEQVAMPDYDPSLRPVDNMLPVDQPRSMLILPGQEGFSSAQAQRPKVGQDERLLVWKEPKEKLPQGKYERRWQAAVAKLIELVNANMPPFIQVVPDGTSQPITIERVNTLADIPPGLVKMEYGLQGQSESSRSSINIGGEILDPMKISLIVSQRWCITDKTVNWEQRVADLVVDAERIFRPRPKEIPNSTPAKPGDVSLLMSGDPRRNAGGYGEVAGDPRYIDPKSESGGKLVLGIEDAKEQQQQKKAPRGPVVPGL